MFIGGRWHEVVWVDEEEDEEEKPTEHGFEQAQLELL